MNNDFRNDKWQCICGRMNYNYVGTCACGRTKEVSMEERERRRAREILEEAEREKALEEQRIREKNEWMEQLIRDARIAELRWTIESEEITRANLLIKYKQLLDSGIITQEEFDNKKRQLLSR